MTEIIKEINGNNQDKNYKYLGSQRVSTKFNNK